MKKVLLSLACVSAMAASAQVTQMKDDATLVPNFSKIRDAKNAILSDTKKSNVATRAAADGVYYKTPVGAMWRLADEVLYGYGMPVMVVAPWKEFVFQNMSTKKEGHWTVNGNSVDDFADESNNLVYSIGVPSKPNSYFYAPAYTEGDVTYIPKYTEGNNVENMGLFAPGIECKSFHPSSDLDGVYFNNWGIISLDCATEKGRANLLGAGTWTSGTNEVYVSLGVEMSYPKPMSPLYVEKLYVQGYSYDKDSNDPLNGKVLTAKIYNLEDDNAEPIVLTCNPEDCKLGLASNQSTYYNTYNVDFSKKIKDEISGELVEDPFVIDYPFVVSITGFEQDGITLGLGGWDVLPEFCSDVEDENNVKVLLKSTVTGKIGVISYSAQLALSCGFYSMFDVCDVMTEAKSSTGNIIDCNGIVVSNDGQTYSNNAYSNLQGVRIYTGLNWTDATTEEEMYWSDDMYDEKNSWIQNLVVNTTTYSDGKTVMNGAYDLGAICDPLPAGVDKRYAVIHIQGRGVTSEDIYVLQGNITLAEAKADHAATAISEISNNAVKANNRKFNLAGQQVDNSFKGIVISNGKKAIKK